MSLMKKYLTDEILTGYAGQKTAFGNTLDQCIKSGLRMSESKIGVFATDPDAFNAFSKLFYPVVRDAHQLTVNISEFQQPSPYYGETETSCLDLSTFDPDGLIISSRVRVGRNLAGFNLELAITEEERLSVAKQIEEALSKLPSHLKGTLKHLEDIPLEERSDLIRDHILFSGDNKFLKCAGFYRDWPSGRCLFRSESDTIHMWVNEEDHLRIISMAIGADFASVFSNLIEAIKALEESLEFARDAKLGYITACPTNIGTGLRASVHVRLLKLSTLPRFMELCSELGLDVRGTHGEYTRAEDALFDISNKRRLGLTEYDAVHQVVHGVKILLLLEQSL